MEYLAEIGIVGVLILIVAVFCIIGFIKGLVKTLMALFTLGASGFAAWWGYHHGPALVREYLPETPAYTHIICSVLGGFLVFFLFYKVFNFIVNPFEGDEENEKKWNFGIPAAGISVLFALGFVYFGINRMRTTHELDKMKEIMAHGIENAPKPEGIHQFVIESLESSKIGQFIFQNDPLWEQNRVKLAKLAILYCQSGSKVAHEHPETKEILTHPAFLAWISEKADISAAIKHGDPSALWDSENLDKMLKNKELGNLLTRVNF